MGRIGRSLQLCGCSAALVFVLGGAYARAQSEPTARWGADRRQAAQRPQRSPQQAGTGKPWRDAMERAPEPPPKDNPKDRIWYGWQTLISDGLGIVLLAVAFSDDEPAPAITGLGLLTLGTPIIHVAHANPQAGLTSLIIRATSLGLAFLGGVLIGNGFFSDDSSDGPDTKVLIGGAALILSVAGALTAVSVDATLLAFAAKPAARTSTSLTPWFVPARGSYGVRLGISL